MLSAGATRLSSAAPLRRSISNLFTRYAGSPRSAGLAPAYFRFKPLGYARSTCERERRWGGMRSLSQFQSRFARGLVGFPVVLPFPARIVLALRAHFAGQLSLSCGWLSAFGLCFIFDCHWSGWSVEVSRITPFGLRRLAVLPVPLAPLFALAVILALGAALGTAAGFLYACF